MKVLEMFKKLSEHIDEKITYEYWKNGELITDTQTLKNVHYYRGIDNTDGYFPFIGCGVAIKSIKLTKTGEELYYNPTVSVKYNKTNQDAIESAKARFYGDAVVLKQKRRRINKEQECARKQEELDKQAILKKPYLKQKGIIYVKDELKEEWPIFVDSIVKDSFSYGILDLTIRLMEALSVGASNDEIKEIKSKFNTSGYTESVAYSIIEYYTNLIKKEKNPVPTLSK